MHGHIPSLGIREPVEPFTDVSDTGPTVMRYAERLLSSDSSLQDLQDVSKSIGSVPAPFLEAVIQHGVKIRLLSDRERYEDASPVLAKFLAENSLKNTPEETLATVHAIYVPGEKTIYATDRKPGALVHEIGHAFDHALDGTKYNYRTDVIVQKAYGAGEFLNSYAAKNAQEAFAEWFRAYSGVPIAALDPASMDILAYAYEQSPTAMRYMQTLEDAISIALAQDPQAFIPNSSFDRKLEVVARSQIAALLGVDVQEIDVDQLEGARDHLLPANISPPNQQEMPQQLSSGESKMSTSQVTEPYDPSTEKQINEFRGAEYFLSNSSPSPVVYEGVRYPTVEHAFAAASTTNETDRRKIAALESPVEARRAARDLQVRPDWEKIQYGVMLELVREKFRSEKEKDRLLATENATLINSNTRGDMTWGVDQKTGIGENWLGNILMQVRTELRSGSQEPSHEQAIPEPSSPIDETNPKADGDASSSSTTVGEQDVFVIESTTKREAEARKIQQMRFHVHANGDVSYRFSDLHSRVFGGVAFTDRGQRITIESKDQRSVKAAMQYAKESWGDHPVLLRISSASGSGDVMLREAVSAGLNVKNPELQNRIKALQEERSNLRFGHKNIRSVRTSARENRENAVERAG